MCLHAATPSDVQLEEATNGLTILPQPELFHVTGFSGADVPVQTSEDPKLIQPARWGLIPRWIKAEADLKYNTANAIGEEIYEKASYKNYIGQFRALMWVNGVYEYQHRGAPGAKAKDIIKVPYYIYKPDWEPYTLGCVYNVWHDRVTVSIITKEANELFSTIHNSKKRMPLIIDEQYRSIWLGELSKKDIMDIITTPYNGTLAAHTVSRDLARNVHSDHEHIKDEVLYDESGKEIIN